MNVELAKKTNIRDIVRSKIESKPVSDKFDEISNEIDDKIPKLTSVLNQMFSSTEFLIELTEFSAESNCKVIYTLDMLIT